MSHIVTDITKDTTTENRQSSIPVVEEHGVGQLPERGGEDNKQSRWHDQPILVHRQIMMDSMEQEVESETDSVIRKISKLKLALVNSEANVHGAIPVNVEQEPMHEIFN